jgi:hypothetical protein
MKSPSDSLRLWSGGSRGKAGAHSDERLARAELVASRFQETIQNKTHELNSTLFLNHMSVGPVCLTVLFI